MSRAPGGVKNAAEDGSSRPNGLEEEFQNFVEGIGREH